MQNSTPIPNPTPTRPAGISIIAFLAVLVGLVSLLGALLMVGCAALLGWAAREASGSATVGTLIAVIPIIAGILSFLSAALNFIFAYGAWNLKPWAWMLGVITQGIGVVVSLLGLFNPGNWLTDVGRLAISGVILYYLFTPEVKAAFQQA